MIIIDGNSAAALGCMFAGVTVVTWYPINSRRRPWSKP